MPAAWKLLTICLNSVTCWPRSPEERVGRVRGEEADRVVAPVVGHAARGERRLGDELVHRQQLDRRDAEVVEVVGHRRGAEAGVGAAQVLGDLVVQLGEALDVQLVDHRVAPAAPQSAGRRPSRSRRARPRCAASRRPSRRCSRTVVLAVVAEERRPGRRLAVDRLGVGVEQQLVGLKRRPCRGSHGPSARIAVALAGPTPGISPCQTPRVCSVSWCRVSTPSSSNRHSQTAVASGAQTAKFVASGAHVAPSVLVPPGPDVERVSSRVCQAQLAGSLDPFCREALPGYDRDRPDRTWRGDAWASSCASRWPTASAPSGWTGRR